VPGGDLLAMRQAEGIRVASQFARGGRSVIRPVAGSSSSPIALDAYLIDSANPDTELRLDTRYPDGLEFGKVYDTDRKREIIFKMQPLLEASASHYYTYWLALRATIEVVNRGSQAADLTESLRLKRLTDLTYKWATLPVTWNNREATWKTEGDSGTSVGDHNFINNTYGGGFTDYDVFAPYPTSIVPGQGATFTEIATYEFNQELSPLSGEDQYWNCVIPIEYNTLPKLGFALKWSLSGRQVGWFDGFDDQNMDINCKFYGYKWFVSSEAFR